MKRHIYIASKFTKKNIHSTHQQMFNAFQGTIHTLQNYRVRLLQTTTNPTSGQVTGLFSQYHY